MKFKYLFIYQRPEEDFGRRAILMNTTYNSDDVGYEDFVDEDRLYFGICNSIDLRIDVQIKPFYQLDNFIGTLICFEKQTEVKFEDDKIVIG